MMNAPIPCWVPLGDGDRTRYESYFAASTDAVGYENSWPFLKQETRLRGWRYETTGILLTATIKSLHSPFAFILPPLRRSGQVIGDRVVRSVLEAARSLHRETGRRVVVRKSSLELCEALLETGRAVAIQARAFHCPADVPEDIYPQVVVATGRDLGGPRLKNLRNQVRAFAQRYAPTVGMMGPNCVDDVREVLARWRHEYQARVLASGQTFEVPDLGADTTASITLAEMFADGPDDAGSVALMVYVGEEPTGFAFASRVSATAAALYASTSLTEYRGSSEYLLSALLDRLAAAGVRALNMGGSETEGLFRFKQKFGVVALRPSYDVEVMV